MSGLVAGNKSNVAAIDGRLGEMSPIRQRLAGRLLQLQVILLLTLPRSQCLLRQVTASHLGASPPLTLLRHVTASHPDKLIQRDFTHVRI